MSVIGIDFGTLHSKIGVARQRGIDIITNEVSNRQTPSLVAFGIKQRAIGEAAKTQETSNFKNTIGSLKRLIGRSVNDPDVQEIEKKFINASLVDVSGSVGVQVRYLGEQQAFSATQLVAMYLGKLRDISTNETKVVMSDVVIAVPGWYTDVQRRALLDAAHIAGLNPLRLINDTTAIALGYGITKSDLPDTDAARPRNVIFVDVGHSSMSVAIVSFTKGQLVVKGTAYDRHLGGRDIDTALLNHFAAEFKERYKVDVLSSPKAIFRLLAGCEKLKKILSANAEAPLNVESLMNDIDASSKLSRDDYERLIASVLDRITAPLQTALEQSGLTLEEIDALELVGGSTRVPAVKAKIQAWFGTSRPLSTTLNQDEAVARGATFACAMLSPVFRVREFHMLDITPYSVKVTWDASQADPDDDTELVVFPRGNHIPSTKVLSFYRKDTFDLEAHYAEPAQLPGAINPWIAKVTVKGVTPDAKGDPAVVKIKTRLNQHGIVSFEAAYLEEIEEKEADAAAMNVDAGEDAAAAPKKKRVVKKKDLPFVTGTSSLDQSVLEKFKEQEAQMHAADKLVADTEDRKNALEEYVYDMRGKLEERYAAFVQAEEKAKLLAELQEAEDWLYSEEGEDATKSAYVARLDALKQTGDPVTFRWREHEERPRAAAQLRETLNTYLSQATSGEERFAHIDAKDLQSVAETCAKAQKWLEDQSVRQSERPKNQNPVLTSAEIVKKRDEVIYFSTPILSKPKPKPPVGSGTATPDTKTGGGQETPKTGKEEQQGPTEMDVD